jgi:NADH dehydrogenase
LIAAYVLVSVSHGLFSPFLPSPAGALALNAKSCAPNRCGRRCERPAGSARVSGAARGVETRFDVLVLGASYLGAELVYLLRRRAPGLRVAVIDRQRAHGYIPLVHERLVGRLGWGASVLRTADFVAREGATFVEGEVVSLDPRAKRVVLADGRALSARFVVVALGSVTTPPASLPGRVHFLGHKLAGETDAARARLAAVLGATGVEAPCAVVVGGGISGIELAGELAHLAHTRPAGWRAPAVTLVHAASRLVPHFAPNVSAAVERSLRAQGVVVRHGARVVGAEEGAVCVRDADGRDERLPSELAFWCGGVRPPAVLGALGLPRTPDGWLAVRPTLACGAFGPDVLAGGDCARVVDERGHTWPTMQRAIEAMWAADTIAAQITRLAKERADYPRAIPALRRHPLRPDFFHGLSLGRDSLVVHGARIVDLGPLNVLFRRFLMWGYLRRYGQWR